MLLETQQSTYEKREENREAWLNQRDHSLVRCSYVFHHLQGGGGKARSYPSVSGEKRPVGIQRDGTQVSRVPDFFLVRGGSLQGEKKKKKKKKLFRANWLSQKMVAAARRGRQPKTQALMLDGFRTQQ